MSSTSSDTASELQDVQVGLSSAEQQAAQPREVPLPSDAKHKTLAHDKTAGLAVLHGKIPKLFSASGPCASLAWAEVLAAQL